MKYFLLLATIIGMLSCKNDASDSTTANTTISTPPPATPSIIYPSISGETMQYLVDNCDYVDYVFYELPISMSLQEKAAIHYSLSHISTQSAIINPGCKAIGRLFYQVKGERIIVFACEDENQNYDLI